MAGAVAPRATHDATNMRQLHAQPWHRGRRPDRLNDRKDLLLHDNLRDVLERVGGELQSGLPGRLEPLPIRFDHGEHVPGRLDQCVETVHSCLTAKGVIFATIEDEHGQANVVVYLHISARDRVPPLTSGLMVVEGRVEREDEHLAVSIVHLIAL